jgi:hypothetical protein
MHIIFQMENLQRSDHLEDPGIDGRTILEWILGKLCGKVWTGSFGLE